MQPKSVIFFITVTLLTGAIFSSSAYFISAEIVTSCTGTSKKTQECNTFDTETDKLENWKCTLNKDGKTWKCVQAMTQTGDTIPFELKKALNLATESAVNMTNTLNDFTSKKNSLLNNDNQITSNEADSPNPPPCPDKGPIPPDCTMKPIIK